MWNVEVDVTITEGRDADHLADIAGRLVEVLEDLAGNTAPVVVGSFRSEMSILTVDLDLVNDDPSSAVSDALALIRSAVELTNVSVSGVHSIRLSNAEAADFNALLASA